MDQKTTTPALSPPLVEKESHRRQNALRISLISTAVMGVLCGYGLYVGIQTGSYANAILTGTIMLFSAICAWLSFRKQMYQGILILIIVFLVVMLAGPFTVPGFGFFFGLLSITATLSISSATLPPKLTRYTVVAALSVGIAVLAIDQLRPDPAPPPTGPIPSIAIFIGLLGIYGFILFRQFPSYTLRTKLVISFTAIGILAGGTVAAILLLFEQRLLVNLAHQSLQASARQASGMVDRFIQNGLIAVQIDAKSSNLVAYLKSSPDEQADSLLKKQALDALQTLRQRSPLFIDSYALLSPAGVNLLDTNDFTNRQLEFQRDYVQMILQGQTAYVSYVQISPDTNDPVLYFSSPVSDTNGEMIGILRVRYKAAILQQLVTDVNHLSGPESFAILVDEQYIQLAHGKDPSLILKPIIKLNPATLVSLQDTGRLSNGSFADLSGNLADLAAGLTKAGSDTPFFTVQLPEEENNLVLASVIRLQTQPWFVVFAQPQNALFAPLQDQIHVTLSVIAGLAIIIGTVAYGAGRVLAGPITRLTQVASKVSAGNFVAKAAVETSDEIGQLAATFNVMTKQLREAISSLETQVMERTTDLVHSLEVGQRAAAIRDLDELLPTISDFIRQQFDLYHVQIYLLDDLGDSLIIKAATGEIGQQLLSNNHRLSLASKVTVSKAVEQKESIIINDTAALREGEYDQIHRDLMIHTQSELAIPLIVADQVIGVLDMHANEVETFTQQNLLVFESMAIHLAIAIDSAQEWMAGQEARYRAENFVRQLTREAWTETLARKKPDDLQFAYNLSSVEADSPEIQNGFSVPVSIQNEAIGHLVVETPEGRQWSRDEKALVTTVAQQLAQKAENIRLLEQIQGRATREQTVRQITDQMRRSRDVEVAIKTATEALNRVLGTSRTVVKLEVPQSLDKLQIGNGANEE